MGVIEEEDRKRLAIRRLKSLRPSLKKILKIIVVGKS